MINDSSTSDGSVSEAGEGTVQYNRRKLISETINNYQHILIYLLPEKYVMVYAWQDYIETVKCVDKKTFYLDKLRFVHITHFPKGSHGS